MRAWDLEENPQTGVKRRFGDSAADYAASAVHARGPDLGWLVDAATPHPEAKVLDVGAGAGHAALALSPHVHLTVALDITPEMLGEARLLSRAKNANNLRLVEGTVDKLPVLSGALDIVTCRVAAHHFGAPARAVREMAQVIRPGGRLVLVDNYVPTCRQLDQFINRLECLRDPTHVRDHTLSQWTQFMSAAGLRVEIRCLDRMRLDFQDWVRRSRTPTDEVSQLRQLLLSALPAAKQAFSITVKPRLGFSLLRFVAVGYR